MDALLRFVLNPPLAAPAVESLEAWWEATAVARSAWSVPVDRAIVGGVCADRLGFAFAGGYAAALQALLPPRQAAPGIMALCASEEGGAHPRAIKTTLTAAEPGRYLLSGRKRWATIATEAAVLLVVASTGSDAEGRNRLRVARVAANAPGLRLHRGGPAPFAPEIPHAEVELAGVAVVETDLLPGDGYADYLKPFRTIEDVHVHAALIGYLIGLALRRRFPKETIERLVAAAIAARSVAGADPKAATTHVALAGVLAITGALVEEIERLWSTSPDDEHTRWERDRPLLRVASNARAARRERAWTTLGA